MQNLTILNTIATATNATAVLQSSGLANGIETMINTTTTPSTNTTDSAGWLDKELLNASVTPLILLCAGGGVLAVGGAVALGCYARKYYLDKTYS